MVFCICGNLEVMRFSRGFSQMRQRRRASGEPSVRHPIRSVLELAGSAAVALSIVTPPPLMSISKTMNLMRFFCIHPLPSSCF